MGGDFVLGMGLEGPCIVRAPGKVLAGTERFSVTATINFLPTFLSLAGGSLPSYRVIDRVDISPLLHGERKVIDRNFFYYQHDCLRAVRNGRWKLMLPHTEPVKGSIATKMEEARCTERCGAPSGF